ncbi:MAG TPA: AI-2E family transporter [Candidatus Eisenbacteria bacterium]|nr:AI-2E family transporter [Candidatus Eisenbacteria bacterium]
MPRQGTSEDAGRTALLVVAGMVAVALMWMLRSIVMMVVFATLLAYALDPLVARVTRIPLPRGARIPQPAAAGLVMAALVAVTIWATVVITPQLLSEAASLFTGLPERLQTLMAQFGQIAADAGYGGAVGPTMDHLQDALPQLQTWLIGWLGRMFSNVVQLAGALVIPLLAFYLLAERGAVRASLLRFVPVDAHVQLEKAGRAIDRALASYVRGQAIVCLVSGTVMTMALTAIGISHALLLGFLVAVAEILPFVGFWIAAVAIGLVGLGEGPGRAALALGAYAVSNGLIALLVTPRVMGRHLKMHPFVVTVSVLAGGELLGPPGVLLALPLAAIAQSLVQTFTAAAPRESRRGAA